ncbi:Abdominal ganglion neuropeptide L11 [Orchesella cincta]|uniref:Abdominal ganglion neuropeptide L11 n=1 Tax=Orchesella cincta TaxID=48709 RepID=A0A1D2MXC8_ORCCI|nr:Abdominal ganglion neuropeptide L11 [Orchesella cincta]
MLPNSSSNLKRMMGSSTRLLCWLFVILCVLKMSEAQFSPVQQIHFVPKNYFMQSSESQIASSSIPADITRNPRHLAPDRYYVGPASSDQSATATTSLRASTLDRSGNPIDFNADLDQELKLDISNNNPHNNQFEAKILPNSPQSIPRKTNRGKSRRTKTRPPKNVIIYSLPEQSFFAAGGGGGDDSSSYSEDSRESSGLRSDLGDEVIEEQTQADSKEFRTSSSSAANQKKALLGQCMAQCIDAIL